jgi:ribonuclease/clavin/mitogillin
MQTKKKTPRASAAVMLVRGEREGLEVYFVRRSQKLRFFGGSWAFPGGVVDESDSALKSRMPDLGSAYRDYGVQPGDPDLGTLLVCALRELFEETGVLLEPLAAVLDPTTEAGREARRELRAGLLPRAGATVEAIETWEQLCEPFLADGSLLAATRPIGRITSPPFRPQSYHTLFLTAELPEGEHPEVLGGELDEGCFERPGDVLAAWNRGERDVVPPVLFLLEMMRDELAGLAPDATTESAVAAFLVTAGTAFGEIARGKLHAAYTSPGILAAPLRTPTLPPAETTNTYLVGISDVYIVDPATYEDDERERLYETLDEWQTHGRRVRGVILTHRHLDHIGSAFCVSQRYGVPVMAHERTFTDLDNLWEDPKYNLGGRPQQLVELEEAQTIDLGIAADGSEGWHLTVRHTPGHAQGHISLHDSRYGTAIVGDMVSTISTIVIEPDEGHLGTYINSLQRLIDVAPGPMWSLLPAHGPWVSDGARLVRRYLAHRAEREASLLRALEKGLDTTARIVRSVYADTPEELWPYAECSLLAGLIKLEEEGRAVCVDQLWAAVPAVS